MWAQVQWIRTYELTYELTTAGESRKLGTYWQCGGEVRVLGPATR